MYMYTTVSINCKRETATVLINAGKQKNNKQIILPYQVKNILNCSVPARLLKRSTVKHFPGHLLLVQLFCCFGVQSNWCHQFTTAWKSACRLVHHWCYHLTTAWQTALRLVQDWCYQFTTAWQTVLRLVHHWCHQFTTAWQTACRLVQHWCHHFTTVWQIVLTQVGSTLVPSLYNRMTNCAHTGWFNTGAITLQQICFSY